MNNIKALANILGLAFLCSLCVPSKGQQNSFELSKIIPPSPTAASLGTFGNNSQGTYNGVPDISIPLFQFKAANQNINIALSYDASGTRTSQDASWVGLGWSLLNGGGVITRTVRGLDDLYPGGYHYSAAIPSETDIYNMYQAPILTENSTYPYVFDMLFGRVDTEPDIFTFNFGDHNGKFVYDKTLNGSNVYQLEATNLKIVHLEDNYRSDNGWKIIDASGNSYYFNSKETATDYSFSSDFELNYDADCYDLKDQNIDQHPITTAWYLDSIVSPSSQKITFTYTNEISQSLLYKSERRYQMLQINSGLCPPPQLNNFTASRQLLNNLIPDKILFDNGSIEFHREIRTDIKTPYNPYQGIVNNYRLSDIVLKDKDGATVKKINFSYSYFNNDDNTNSNKRLKLDQIQEFSWTAQAIPPYTFTYYNPNALPPKYTKAIDHWGYYNGQTGNTTLLPPAMVQPSYSNSYLYISGAKRLPDNNLNSVQNGVLSSITYPTGGHTNFTYELNEYTNLYGDDKYEETDAYVSLECTYDGAPTVASTFVLTEPREVTFFFNYGYRDNPNYRDEFIPNYAILKKDGQDFMTFHNWQYYPQSADITTQKIVLLPGTYTMNVLNVYSCNTEMSASWVNRTLIKQRKGGGLRINKIENTDASNITSIKKYLYDENGVSTGQLMIPVKYDFTINVGGMDACNFPLNALYFIRHSNTLNSAGFTKNGLIGYSKVTELFGEHGENGKIVYFFNNEPTPYMTMPTTPIAFNPLNGKLSMTKFFDASNQLIKQVENLYTVKPASTTDASHMPGLKLLNFPVSFENFYLQPYYNYTSWIVESTQIESSYTDNKVMTSLKNYYYDNLLHKQMTKSEHFLSNRDMITTINKYPTDFASSGTPNEYNEMVNRNILNPVVEQTTYKNNTTLLQTTKTNYQFWNGTAFLAPGSIQKSNAGNTLETEVAIINYDTKGNMLQVSKRDGVATSYLWDYALTYPIAEVNNASYASISATSFEADGKGNWDWAPDGVITGGVTGKKSFNLNGHNITRTGLSSGTNYTATYWLKNSSGSCSLGGTPLISKNGWLLYQTILTSTTSLTISGSGLIDELRLYPTDAQMATSTFEPLVGITSQCDVNNRITYYEYDDFNRLKLIRDQDKNIIKSFCYSYYNSSPTACANTPVFYNQALSQTFTKNNCGVGYTAGTIVYTVPANAYSSFVSQADANNKAQNDVTTNGQNYANANASCTLNTVYAKLTLANPTETFRHGCDNRQSDIVVSFYQDAACTIPISVSNLTVTIVTNNDLYDPNNGDTYTQSYNSYVCNGTSLVLSQQITYSACPNNLNGGTALDGGYSANSFALSNGTGYIIAY